MCSPGDIFEIILKGPFELVIVHDVDFQPLNGEYTARELRMIERSEVFGFTLYLLKPCLCCGAIQKKEIGEVYGFIGYSWNENNLFFTANEICNQQEPYNSMIKKEVFF